MKVILKLKTNPSIPQAKGQIVQPKHLRQLKMKLQTLNILHSISCFLFYAWSDKKSQSKPVVLRRSQKFYTASRAPSPPWPLRLDIDLSGFSGGRKFLPERYSGPEKARVLPVFIFPSYFLEAWWCETVPLIPSFTLSSVSVLSWSVLWWIQSLS